MPEAIKEVQAEKTDTIIAKEVKPAVASSGSLPSEELPVESVGEGAVAPDVASDKPEESKNSPELIEPEENGKEKSTVETKEGQTSADTSESKKEKSEEEEKPVDSKEEKISGVSQEANDKEKSGADAEAKDEKPSNEEEKSTNSSGLNEEEKSVNTPEVKGEEKSEPLKEEVAKTLSSKESDVDQSSSSLNGKAEDYVESKTDRVSDSSSNATDDQKGDNGNKVDSTKELNLDADKKVDSSGEQTAEKNVEQPSNQMEIDNSEDKAKEEILKESEDKKPEECNLAENKKNESQGSSVSTEADACKLSKTESNETKPSESVSNSSDTASVPNGNADKAEAGRSTEIDPAQVEEVKRLTREAKEQMVLSEFFNAADLYGKACEIAGKLYGELASENAELYYLYGCAMLECAKNENTVLGEAVKENEEEGDDSEANEKLENGDSEGKQDTNNEQTENKESNDQSSNGDEKMEIAEENGTEENGVEENGDEGMEDDQNVPTTEDTDNGGDSETTGEEGKENEEDEDSSLKTAWEMFELAKVIFSKNENELRLSDTYIKLGEVGMESGHPESIEDMKKALELRLKCDGGNDRLLAETHFNIGLAYGTFQEFDSAIEAFQQSKSLINGKIEKLKAGEQTKETETEVKELSELLPDLDDKVQDMRDSKKAKLKEMVDIVNGVSSGSGIAGEGSSKPASNITHLVKRKRKLEDVASELLPNNKQACTEEAKSKEPEK